MVSRLFLLIKELSPKLSATKLSIPKVKLILSSLPKLPKGRIQSQTASCSQTRDPSSWYLSLGYFSSKR